MMIKKDRSKLGQVLIIFGKGVVRIAFGSLFFFLRIIVFYYLCRRASHPHWLALLSGFVLACGSNVI